MDTTGAMLGPLLAFAMLAIAPLAFDSIFLVSFCLALLGFGCSSSSSTASARCRCRGAHPAPSLRGAFALVDPALPRALIAGGALSLATASDAFVFLALQEKLDLGTSLFPLLFVGSAGTFMACSPLVGSPTVVVAACWLAGGLLQGVYVALLLPLAGVVMLAATLGLLGRRRGHRRRADGAREHRRARGRARQRASLSWAG